MIQTAPIPTASALSETQEGTAPKPQKSVARFLADMHNHTILFRSGRLIFVSYGLVAAFAFLIGSAVAGIFGTLRGADPVTLLSFSALVLAPSVLIGSRAFSVLLEWRSLFSRPIETLLKPGYMLHGGVFGGMASMVIYSQVTGMNLWLLTDAFALAMPLGEAIQRIGCHVYGCCWGKPTHTHHGISYISSHAKVVRMAPELRGQNLYPVQLMATGAHTIQFLVFAALLPILPSAGVLSGLYMITHPLIRVALERFREDDRGTLMGPITHTHMYAAIQFLLGATLLGAVLVDGQPIVWQSGVSFGAFITDATLIGFLLFNFLLAALAFGVHFDNVGHWIPLRKSLVLTPKAPTTSPLLVTENAKPFGR